MTEKTYVKNPIVSMLIIIAAYFIINGIVILTSGRSGGQWVALGIQTLLGS